MNLASQTPSLNYEISAPPTATQPAPTQLPAAPPATVAPDNAAASGKPNEAAPPPAVAPETEDSKPVDPIALNPGSRAAPNRPQPEEED